MQAYIYQPSKTSMQSGLRNTKDWILIFAHDGSRKIEPSMGWISSKDTMQEVRMKFPNKESAIAFAEKNQFNFEVITPKQKKFVKRTYAENFL